MRVLVPVCVCVCVCVCACVCVCKVDQRALLCEVHQFLEGTVCVRACVCVCVYTHLLCVGYDST